ncbi:hypothetical protein HDU89_004706 [Geranomyces variabilis]|nr:hypothetical protein HDU89_004706 [Geranomyces variabilis]
MVSSANLLLTSSAVLLGLTGLAIAQVIPPMPTAVMPSVPFPAVPFPSAPSPSAPSPLLGCGDLFTKFSNDSGPLADCFAQALNKSGDITSQRKTNAMLIDLATCQCPLVVAMEAEITRYSACSQKGSDWVPTDVSSFIRHCKMQDYPAAADDAGFPGLPPDWKKGGFHWNYRASGSNGTVLCSDYKKLIKDAAEPCSTIYMNYIFIELFREDFADIVSLCRAEPNFSVRGMDVSPATRDTVIAACKNKDYKSVADATPELFTFIDNDANKEYHYNGGPGTNPLKGLSGSSSSGARAYHAATVVSAATGAVLAWAASQF